MFLIIALMGCDRADPELVEQRAALDAWRAGEDALQDAPAQALQHFADSLEARPGDPVLLAWAARAAARSGDLDGARVLLDEALLVTPDFAHARYNRAAYAARQGDLTAAGADLEIALAQGAALPRDVLDDPDFAAHLGDPALSFLPVEPLQIVVEAPQTTVFWGSEFAVRFRVAGAYDLPLSVTAERSSGPVSLVRAVEDVSMSTAGPMRDLTWTWRVLGEGTIDFGPFHTWSSARRTRVEGVQVVAASPPGRAHADPGFVDFATPGELAVGRQAPDAWAVDGELRVLYQPGQTVTLSPEPPTAPIRYELRNGSETVWTLDRWPTMELPVGVQVHRAGTLIVERRITR